LYIEKFKNLAINSGSTRAKKRGSKITKEIKAIKKLKHHFVRERKETKHFFKSPLAFLRMK